MTASAARRPSSENAADPAPPLAVIVKGYPRLSETFVAQELAGLEDQGLRFDIWSLRRPTDRATHPIHARIRARVRYLPEYLRRAPIRVARGLASQLLRAGFWRAARVWLGDLVRDRTLNRVRRFGQAAVLARELPPETRFLYVHFLHTPASAARYAALMRGLEWGFAAHAKDIWTIPAWEKREKLAEARFGVTCTGVGAAHLSALAPDPRKMALVYHGLDLSRFPEPPAGRPPRDGRDPADPAVLVSVGRLVEKKGYDDLLAALARLPAELAWRFVHIGGGALKDRLAQDAARLGVADRIDWRGAQAQSAVIEALRAADLFVLPSRVAADGDRDGLPNVLMEAASQRLPVISTDVSAIPEFVAGPAYGRLVPERDPAALADAIAAALADPVGRAAQAAALRARLESAFGAEAGVRAVSERLEEALAAAAIDPEAAAAAALREA